ncbi:hypothetical protein IGI04_003133 [Brassica rapa subsp. trilocularis]|uniref:Uncharacterized protein n=1 Tax=Brassica rapa subsp. trilocularis TaxID=1813537 RepID=A0ABQ7NZJ0_BRACM|nr:hypothetical protein IGI04_003133 [Brassica rapa subsp. trilocularis]
MTLTTPTITLSTNKNPENHEEERIKSKPLWVPKGVGTDSSEGFDLSRMKRPMLRLHNPHLKNKVHGHSSFMARTGVDKRFWSKAYEVPSQANNRLESNADTNPGAAPFSRGFAKIYLECVITYASLHREGDEFSYEHTLEQLKLVADLENPKESHLPKFIDIVDTT